MRRLAIVATLFFIAIGIFIFSLPTLLSTHWANQRILSMLNSRIPGKLEADNLSFSWLGPQKMELVRLFDPQGKVVVSLDSFSSYSSIFNLLSKTPEIGDTVIKQLDIQLLQDPSGQTNLSASLGLDSLELNLPAGNKISVSHVDLELAGSSNAGFSIVASGETIHGDINGRFAIDLKNSPTYNKWQADIQHFPVGIIEALISVVKPEASGIPSAVIGDSFNLNIDQTSQEETARCTAYLESPLIQLVFKGKIEGGEFSLDTPFKTVISLSSKNLSKWKIALQEDVKVDLQLQEANIPVNFFSFGLDREALKKFVIKGSLSTTLAKFKLADGTRMVLKDLNFDLTTHNQSFKITAAGIFSQNEKPIPFHIATEVNKPNLPERILLAALNPKELRLTLPHTQTGSLDAFFATDFFEQVFGSELTMALASKAEDPQSLYLQLNSERIDIPSLQLKLDQPLEWNEDTFSADYSGEIIANAILFKQKDQLSAVRSFKTQWSMANGFRDINATYSGQTQIEKSNTHGTFEGGVNLNGKQNIKASLIGKNIPAPFLEFLSGQRGWGAIFGPAITLQLETNMKSMEGPFDLDISGLNGLLNLHGKLKSGAITLQKTALLETKPTEDLGKEILKKIAPVFNELIGGEELIRLTVDKNGFFLPIMPFSLEKAQIGSAVLDLGKLHFRNAGDIKRLLHLLKTDNVDQASIWATPLYFRIDNGFLTLSRTDLLLLDNYPLATWGTVDFNKDRVSMFLGLTGQTLANAFGVQGVSKGTMLQIPITGKTSNPKIDSSKAMTKIGSLMVKQNGGPEGLVLGTVLDLANGKEAKVPPPTTNPLPWHEMVSSSPKETRSSNDSLKDIKKGATKLLKGLFQ